MIGMVKVKLYTQICKTYLYNSQFRPSILIGQEAFRECWYKVSQRWDFMYRSTSQMFQSHHINAASEPDSVIAWELFKLEMRWEMIK